MYVCVDLSAMSDNKMLSELGFKEVSIPQQKQYDGMPFPLVLNPAVNRSAEEWSKVIQDNHDTMKALTTKYGAILFRGFPLETPKCFDDFSKAFGYRNFPYLGGPAPRKMIVGNVITANDATPEKKMSFHHEMAYLADVPGVVFFYCDIQAEEGGNTPVALSWPIYKDVKDKEPELVKKMADEGLIYTRVQPNATDETTIISASWQSSYFTQSKEEAVRLAEGQDCTCEWLENDCLRITSKLPAFSTDSVNNKTTWFNNSLAYYVGYQNKWNESTKTIMFGNGEYLPAGPMNTVKNVMDDHAVYYMWQRCDVIIMDNFRVLHSREQFKGKRNILAALYK